MEVYKSSIEELKQLLDKKEISSEELVKVYLERAKSLNQGSNGWISFNDKALHQARAIDKKRVSGEKLGLLAGIPLGLKDMFCVKGLRTTAGSKMLENFVAPYSSTVAKRLIEEGAVIIGKNNQDEFAMGSSNETSYYGAARNPWNLEYVPGGSSGGSAAAVSSFSAPAAIGTDTGGSVRQPANFCGLVGFKPTYGRISRFGIVSYASSLDQAGPITLTVEDSAILSEIMAGDDENDSTCLQMPPPKWSGVNGSDIKGLKIGVVKEFLNLHKDPEVEKSFQKTIDELKAQGTQIVEVSIPLVKESVSIYYLIAMSEASANLSRYDGVRYGYRSNFEKEPAKDLLDFYSRNRGESFGSEVKRRICLGAYTLSSGYYEAFYNKACKVRRLLKEEFLKAYEACEVIMAPVSSTAAFKVGSKIQDPVQMYNNDIFTSSVNLAGLPAISVPVELNSEKLPMGVQFIAAPLKEEVLFKAGKSIENIFDFRARCLNVL